MRQTRSRVAWVGLALVGAMGCVASEPKEEPPPTPRSPTVVTDVGFSTPESVLHDPEADVYLVSQVNGNPLEADGNGFISRLSPDGEVLELRWIGGGAEGVTLNAPKGLALVADRLYVADLDTVRAFDRRTARPRGEVVIPGATFLNDLVAAPQGGVYVSDTGLKAGAGGLEPSGSGAVYHVGDDWKVTTVVADSKLAGPNGLAVDGGRLLVVSFASNKLCAIEDGKAIVLAELPAGGLDGIVALPDGRWAISSWEGQAVYAGPLEGPYDKLLSDVQGPADIGVDTGRRRLLVPKFTGNAVLVYPLG